MVLTLEETLADQQDLIKLCSDRQLETKEIFEPNAFYGIDSILKKYAGLPSSYPLRAVVPHGVVLSDDYLWEAERNILLPVVFNYSPNRQAVYASKTRKVVLSVASPFIYLTELLKGHDRPNRCGTIFFPAHSSHRVAVKMDFAALSDALEKFDDEFKPITICIYWRDFNLGYHMAFQKKGFRIVSAGHIYDPYFLFRLYHLCSIHRYAAGSLFGSHLFYSVKSGCSYFHFDSIVNWNTSVEESKRDISIVPKDSVIMLKKLFGVPRSGMSQKQLDIVDYYLGTRNLGSPEQLRAQLLFAERLDKIGFAKYSETDRMYFVMPTYYPRKAIEFARDARRKISMLWSHTK